MAQISKGDTFTDGQQVTGARLNQLVDSSQLLVGAITEQPAMTANTLESVDNVIIGDSGTLKKATVGDVLNSNLQITASSVLTSAINGSVNNDIILTPYDGVTVTGKVFTSSDGIIAVVTSAEHGLQSGQAVSVTASNTAYSGTYAITVLTVDTFSYKIRQVSPVSAGGTCSYTRKATELIKGNRSSSSNSFVGGSSTIVGSQIVQGNESVDGNLDVVGTMAVKGQSTFTVPPKLGTTDIKPRLDYFVQTRAIPQYVSGWGGLQNLTNIYGTKIPDLNLTFTPQKAGNKVVLTWTICAEAYNSGADCILLVTRTPNAGTGVGVAVAIPDSVDSQNNTWSGIGILYDGNDDSTPQIITIKIVDHNTLDVECTYSVHFRASNNRTTTLFLNRTVGSAGGLDRETGFSMGHAQEIYT